MKKAFMIAGLALFLSVSCGKKESEAEQKEKSIYDCWISLIFICFLW